VWRWLAAVKGVLLVVSAVASGGLSWLILGLLAPVAEQHRLDGVAVPRLVQLCLDHRGAVLPVAGAAIACGLLLLLARRGVWLWFTVGMALVLLLVGVVLVCFIQLVGVLYQPVEL
jgi:hypothetical protein